MTGTLGYRLVYRPAGRLASRIVGLIESVKRSLRRDGK
jgi:hypothetical protein